MLLLDEVLQKVALFLIIEFYNPEDIIFQNVPIKGKIESTKVNRVRIGYVFEISTSVCIQRKIEVRWKFNEISESIRNKEACKVSPPKNFVKTMFKSSLRQKEEENVEK